MTKTIQSIDDPTTETKALLDLVAQADLPALHTLKPLEARAQYRARAGASAFPTRELGEVDDLVIRLAGRKLPARLYIPQSSAHSLPLMVYFHGGGMVIGDLETHDSICRRLSEEAGAAVVSVEYRKAPETPFPGAVHDAIEAFAYLINDWSNERVDPARVIVAGDSAGGTLAAVVAQSYAGQPERLMGQVLIYPALDHVTDLPSRAKLADQFPINTEAMNWYDQQYFQEASHKNDLMASPGLCPDLSGIAPSLIITAGLDPLRDEAALYSERVAAHAVGTKHVHYPGVIHGFLGMGAVIPEAASAIGEIANFVTRIDQSKPGKS